MTKIPNIKKYQPVQVTRATAIMVGDTITGIRLAVCKLHPDEEPVQNGLAFTPSRMLKLASEGTPISEQTAAGVFDDGYHQLDFEPLPEYRRGVDMADLWELQQSARKQVHGLFKKAREKQQQQQQTE